MKECWDEKDEAGEEGRGLNPTEIEKKRERLRVRQKREKEKVEEINKKSQRKSER